MGQQQLLILLIAVLIGSEAIWGSARYIDSMNQQNERDQIVIQIHSVITDAIQYQLKPNSMGGGGGSLEGYQPSRNLTQKDRCTIECQAFPDYILIIGKGIVPGTNEDDPVQVQVTYRSADKSLEIENIN